MSQQQLDLLEIAPGLAAQLRAGPAQVVRRQLAELGLPGIADDQAPDRLFVLDGFAPNDPALCHRPEEPALGDAGGTGPLVDAGLDA